MTTKTQTQLGRYVLSAFPAPAGLCAYFELPNNNNPLLQLSAIALVSTGNTEFVEGYALADGLSVRDRPGFSGFVRKEQEV